MRINECKELEIKLMIILECDLLNVMHIHTLAYSGIKVKVFKGRGHLHCSYLSKRCSLTIG